MGFKLNLTGEDIASAQGTFTPLPAATYGAVIYENTQKKSKGSGNEMFETNYKIVEGPAGLNRKIKSWSVLTGKGSFKLVELNKALGGAKAGFPYPDKNTKPGEFEFTDADEYLGKKVNLQITVEDYNSVDDDGNDVTKQQNRVAKVLPYDEDKITTKDELENEGDAGGGLFL